MNKEKIIKEIEECFDDLKRACEAEIGGAAIIPLFRDYTDEIIKIIRKNKET